MKRLILAALLLLFALAVSGFRGKIGGSSATATTDKATLLYDMDAPYPASSQMRFRDAVENLTNQPMLLFTAKSEPQNGFNAGVLKNLTFNPGTPSSLILANRRMALFDVLIIGFDGGVADTVTSMFASCLDTTQVKGWIPRSNLEGLFEWPMTEGQNEWVTLGASDRTGTQKIYCSTIHLNMEFTDSAQVWVRGYHGNPWEDTLWVNAIGSDQAAATGTMGSFYHAGEWLLVPSKGDLYGRRLHIQGRREIPRNLDLDCIGITPAGKSGFIRLLSYGYGGVWNLPAALPWLATGRELNYVRPDISTSIMEEEDLMIYRGYGPIWTTLSSAVSAGDNHIHVNEPALGSWAAYVPAGHNGTVYANSNPFLVWDDYPHKNDTVAWSGGLNVLTDAGATWTLTTNASPMPTEFCETGKSARYAFASGDTVCLYGNWWYRATGGEDGLARGAYYNAASQGWRDIAGAPNSRSGSDYAIDSLISAGSFNRGDTHYRCFGPDVPQSFSFNFDANNRLWFYMQKTRNWQSGTTGADSLWRRAWLLESTLVFYTNDLFEGNGANKFTQQWTSATGDGYAWRDDGAVGAGYVAWTNSTAATASNSTDTASYGFPFATFTTSASLLLSRLYFPFYTDATWEATTNGLTRVVDDLWLTFYCRDIRMNAGISHQPVWKDSLCVEVVASTQASMTALVNNDFDNVGEDSLGGFRLSECASASWGGIYPIQIHISPTALVDGANTKLALRFKTWDIDQIEPLTFAGAQAYLRYIWWSGSSMPPTLTVAYHLE